MAAPRVPVYKSNSQHAVPTGARAQPLTDVPTSPSSAPRPKSPGGMSPPGKRALWQRGLKRLQATWPSLVVTRVDRATGYRKRSITLNAGRRLQKRHKPIHYNGPPMLERLGKYRHVQGGDRAYSFDDASVARSKASTARASSVFGISGFINDFAYQVERSFLSPLEESIYQRMLHITGTSRQRPLSHSDVLVLIMDDQDSASAAAAVSHTVRTLSMSDRNRIYSDLERLLTNQQKMVLKHVLFDNIEIRCNGHESRCSTPESVAEPVFRYAPARQLTYGQAPRAKSRDGLLGRSISSANILNQVQGQVLDRGRPFPRTGGEYSGVFSRRETTYPYAPLTSTSETDLRMQRLNLRGGGDESARSKLKKAVISITNIYRRSKQNRFTCPRRLEDDERPNAVLWWLAGGRLKKREEHWAVPTAATLRERRVLEEETRELVGFWGTVRGVREVQRTRAGLEVVCKKIQNGVEGAQGAKEEGAKEESANEATRNDGMKGDDAMDESTKNNVASGVQPAAPEAEKESAKERPKEAESDKTADADGAADSSEVRGTTSKKEG